MRRAIIALFFTLVILAFAEPTFAYLGPGIGAGAITIILVFIASIFLALFAVFWYPIKRLFKKKKGKGASPKKTEGS